MKSLVSFVTGTLTDWTDESLASAVGIDADEV